MNKTESVPRSHRFSCSVYYPLPFKNSSVSQRKAQGFLPWERQMNAGDRAFLSYDSHTPDCCSKVLLPFRGVRWYPVFSFGFLMHHGEFAISAKAQAGIRVPVALLFSNTIFYLKAQGFYGFLWPIAPAACS